MSSMRAATSPISDSMSGREDKPERPRKFQRLTPSFSTAEQEDRGSISAEERGKSVQATSDASATGPTRTRPSVTPDNLTERGVNEQTEPATSRPSSHQDHAQAFFTPEPQPYVEAEADGPSALPTELENRQMPEDGKNAKITPEPRSSSQVEAPNPLSLPSEPKDRQTPEADERDAKITPEPQSHQNAEVSNSSAPPSEVADGEMPEDKMNEKGTTEPQPYEDSEVSSSSVLSDESMDEAMPDSERNEKHPPGSQPYEGVEVPPSVLSNEAKDGEKPDSETNEKRTAGTQPYEETEVTPSVLPNESEDGEMSEDSRNEKIKDLSFMAELKRTILCRTDNSKQGSSVESRDEMNRPTRPRKVTTDRKAGAADDDVDVSLLPERKHADRLVSIYLTREYVNLPILDLSSFHSKYRALFSEEVELEGDTDIFAATLNMVFALASLTMHPDKQNVAETHFTRAENLVPLGGFRGESVGHVQIHILSSQYLLAMNDLGAAWQSIGNAIRIAQSLWLHLGSGSQHLTMQHDRELARRLWYGCIVMER